jgi:amino acid transporter
MFDWFNKLNLASKIIIICLVIIVICLIIITVVVLFIKPKSKESFGMSNLYSKNNPDLTSVAVAYTTAWINSLKN